MHYQICADSQHPQTHLILQRTVEIALLANHNSIGVHNCSNITNVKYNCQIPAQVIKRHESTFTKGTTNTTH